jgi:hypothetical protein
MTKALLMRKGNQVFSVLNASYNKLWVPKSSPRLDGTNFFVLCFIAFPKQKFKFLLCVLLLTDTQNNTLPFRKCFHNAKGISK